MELSGAIFDPAEKRWLDPAGLAHVYTFNGDGTPNTDTATNGQYTWVKTYSYTSGVLTGESVWVRQ